MSVSNGTGAWPAPPGARAEFPNASDGFKAVSRCRAPSAQRLRPDRASRESAARRRRRALVCSVAASAPTGTVMKTQKGLPFSHWHGLSREDAGILKSQDHQRGHDEQTTGHSGSATTRATRGYRANPLQPGAGVRRRPGRPGFSGRRPGRGFARAALGGARAAALAHHAPQAFGEHGAGSLRLRAPGGIRPGADETDRDLPGGRRRQRRQLDCAPKSCSSACRAR